MGIFDRIRRIVRSNMSDGGIPSHEELHDSDAELRRIIDELRRPAQASGKGPSPASGSSQFRSRRPARESRESPEQRDLRISYAALGCTPSSTNDDVKAAYRRLMRDNHPDTMARASVQDQERAKARSQEINRADEIVSRHRGMK
ncbi:MAG: DnaJ domain-containing protein [Candidatus Kapaibacterium sp.]